MTIPLLFLLLLSSSSLLLHTSSLPDGETPPSIRSTTTAKDSPLDKDFCQTEGIYFRQLLAGVDFAQPHQARTPFEQQSFKFAKQMQNYVYLIGDRSTGEAVVVDGCWDPKGIHKISRTDGMTLVGFVATHYHWDHVGGQVDYEPFKSMGVDLPGLKDFVMGSKKTREKKQIPAGKPVRKAWISTVELRRAASRTGVPVAAFTGLHDGSVVDIGTRLRLTFRHTPGHSPGSMIVLVSDRSNSNEDAYLFMVSGDTLFPGSCGRVDLPESNPAKMYASFQVVKSYEDALVVFPGHSYSGSNTTIGKEKKNGLLGVSEQDWLRGR